MWVFCTLWVRHIWCNCKKRETTVILNNLSPRQPKSRNQTVQLLGACALFSMCMVPVWLGLKVWSNVRQGPEESDWCWCRIVGDILSVKSKLQAVSCSGDTIVIPGPKQFNFLYLFRGDPTSAWFTQDMNWDRLTGDVLYISETCHNILQQYEFVFKIMTHRSQNNAIPRGHLLSSPVLKLAAAHLLWFSNCIVKFQATFYWV